MRQLLFTLLSCLPSILLAQDPDATILTVNDETVTVREFVRVYEKNLNLVQTREQRDPKAYLDLFIDYKLKVQKAYDLQLDQKPTYVKELANYRKQLVKSHLTDIEVTDELIKEAYNRLKEERRGRHILIRVGPTALPQDTLAAYQKIVTARNRILSKEDFTTVAKEMSEDPSAQQNGGDLGYFKAFKMVYPFETAAYETAVGEVSEPFRTRFGYHIVQPTDSRLSKGSVTVAHIMVGVKQADSTIFPEQRIQEVYQKLTGGASFEDLARNYSDDKNTAAKGGELRPIEEGQLSIPVFEQKAFNLNTIGEYTAPFETEFGWHIVKLLKKTPLSSFDEMKNSLQQQIVKDARAQVINDNLNLKLRSLYKIGTLNETKDFFKNAIPEDFKTYSIDTSTAIFSKPAFKLKDQSFTYKDIARYLMGQVKTTSDTSRDAFIEAEIEEFVTTTIRGYHEDHLEEIDPEFSAVLREYKEGLLLFDLLETEIWEKAKTDSIGLQNYYDKNKRQFYSEEEVEAIVATTTNKKNAKKIKKFLKSTSEYDTIKSELERTIEDVIIVQKSIPIKDLPKGVDLSKNTITTLTEESSYITYKIKDRRAAQERPLEKVRGLVISAYQKNLENLFVENLKKNASININSDVLKEIEKKYDDK